MSPFIGLDEICDLTDDQKVLLSSFILVNKPYNLKVKLTKYKNLKCFQDDKTLINMYRSPFAIENENGDINQEISYLISRGEDKTKVIIYRQDNLKTDFAIDAVMYEWMGIKQLDAMINAGLLSKEGRKYVSYCVGSASETREIFDRYMEFLHPDEGKHCKFHYLPGCLGILFEFP